MEGRTLQVSGVELLREALLLDKSERVDNVVDLRGGILDALLGFLGGSVGTGICNGDGVSRA
jgi:hypothetical protein